MASKKPRLLILRRSAKAAPKYPFAINRIEFATLSLAALLGCGL